MNRPYLHRWPSYQYGREAEADSVSTSIPLIAVFGPFVFKKDSRTITEMCETVIAHVSTSP
ncbi:MAG: hypothetical protein V8K32_10485 [Candidatus Electrothrix gigas]